MGARRARSREIARISPSVTIDFGELFRDPHNYVEGK
jgi:hypothetical protein